MEKPWRLHWCTGVAQASIFILDPATPGPYTAGRVPLTNKFCICPILHTCLPMFVLPGYLDDKATAVGDTIADPPVSFASVRRCNGLRRGLRQWHLSIRTDGMLSWSAGVQAMMLHRKHCKRPLFQQFYIARRGRESDIHTVCYPMGCHGA